MRVYAINDNENQKRVLIDFKNPAPLVSIPLDMWMDGLKDFKGVWTSCCFSKTHTKKDRTLYTIYRSDVIGQNYTSDGEPIISEDDKYYVNIAGSDEPVELKKGKLNLFYGIKDTTSEHWDKFCYMLRQKECELDSLGRSYREINIEDARCWWEFHIYDESVKVQGHRPIPFYSEEIVDWL